MGLQFLRVAAPLLKKTGKEVDNMLIIIARVRSDKRVRASFTHDEAYRIFNTENNSFVDVARKDILNMLKAGVKIKGLKIYGPYNNLSTDKGSYSLNKVPFIDGYGEVIDTNQKDIRVVYGYKGFAEAKRFCTVNYKGDIEEIDVTDFLKILEDNKINGAKLVDGKISVCKELYNEIA